MPRTTVDRGGTFTDVVVFDDDGSVRIRKVPSDVAVVGELAEGALVFGTTVATNALLERRVARTALVVSSGFADLPWIGDMSRPSLFEPEATWPEPLCAAVVEVDGRLSPSGEELEPLGELGAGVAGAEAVAVALLHSHADPAHERAVGRRLAAAARPPSVVLGHEVSAEVGYLARVETALVDAAVTPVLRDAMARDRIPAGARAMRSDGSLVDAESLRAVDAVLSGPAGGVLAVEAVAEAAGFSHAIGLDMGGTSTDVCCVEVGRPRWREGDVRVGGVRVRRRVLEVETIAAGGGSILGFDGVRLTVGPRSAGADPGPQCYGRGGPPTLTDAALALGLVQADAFDPPLDRAAVQLPGPASAFLEIARETMAAAVRRLATARGLDLTDHALVAYGGAAGQHAAEVAARLGVRTVLVHPCASVLSAFGQVLARREEHAAQALWTDLAVGAASLPAAWASLAAGLPALGELERSVEVRVKGTDAAIELIEPESTDPMALAAAFRAQHRARFGFVRDGELELVNARVRVRAARPTAPRVDDDPWGLGDAVVDGPALLTSPTTAVAVPAGWRARRRGGLLWLEALAAALPSDDTARTPAGVALWGARFSGVAESAGALLQRLARSVNIRERLDFSCAVFDGEGCLVANAPHVPVHLGAMGETVRDLIARHPAAAHGTAWLSNDPEAGGSHLPDLTVVSVVAHEGHRFFVASRAHHVDVGGTVPGSMPPRATRLSEEGFVVRQLSMLTGGRLSAEVRAAIEASRQPATVAADLEAQLAANAHAARALVGLGPARVLSAWMAHLADAAEEAVAGVIEGLEPAAATDEIDGVPLRIALRPEGGRLVVDLTGTGGPHRGNLNAPRAVVRAAVLYALRVLVGREVPLNDGALRRVQLRLPSPSIVSPPPGAAVAGGNVETSQRIADLVLVAAGRCAAGQGTMNNLTMGGEGWAFYETIGGGGGASASGPGASARQVHMTNTRATDPEVLATRLPVRVRRFAIRRGSGGAGRWCGGDGLVRELEVLVPTTVALLATRRAGGAPGVFGGGRGAPGRDLLIRHGMSQAWDGSPTVLDPGDRVVVSTPGGGAWEPPRAS